MNGLLTVLIWALLAASLAVVRADDSHQKRSSRENPEKRKEDSKPSLNERDAKAKEGRKTNEAPSRSESEKRREQFKHMTPEERAAKRKEIKGRLEKRIAELRAKQTNATLSAQETRELERREQILKRFEQEPGAPRIERARPVLTNAPLEK